MENLKLAEKAAHERTRRSRETSEEVQLRRTADAASHRSRRSRETSEDTQLRREANLKTQRSRRSRETSEDIQLRREANLESTRSRRSRETLIEAQLRRAADLEIHQTRLANETSEQSEVRRTLATAAQQLRREQETPAQTQSRREADAEAHRRAAERRSEAIRQEAINFVEARVDLHNCGPFDVRCHFCGSKNFFAERPTDKKFISCCRKGKVKLPKPIDINGVELSYPQFLCDLLSNPRNPNYANFRENIRSYNNAMSFAHLQPSGSNIPQLAQLYVLDSAEATDIRANHPANENCKREILDQIDQFFRAHNRLASTYQMMRNIEEQETQNAIQAGNEIPLVSMSMRRDRQSDQRRYNNPTSNEIAMVFVNADGEPPFERDIRIYPKNPEDPEKQYINISILSANLDPMSYAILYPYGQPGWQTKWKCESYEGAQANKKRENVTMQQFKAAQTAIRDEFNPVMSAGKLTQQWIVDSYLQVEANNLNYVRQNQFKIRAENYKNLTDHLANLAENLGEGHQAGVSVILPSSFQGSPRNMREKCCDAMSIFSKFGAPDLFITFTANINWPEITENLKQGETTSDQPDLVARVFKIKLDSLIADLTKHHVLSRVTAHVYIIEFQKRGLPHAHILATLRAEDKFTTAQRIDKTVCAEIPIESENPRLCEIVLRCMMHGPCGIHNPHAPCMVEGKCSKMFPKEFNETTQPNVEGYPKYRRRPGVTAVVRNVTMDNRSVVPYNPYLT